MSLLDPPASPLAAAQPGWRTDGLGVRGAPAAPRGPALNFDPCRITPMASQPVGAGGMASPALDAAQPGMAPFPWIGNHAVDGENEYQSWLGSLDASFVDDSDDTIDLIGFGIYIADPDDDTSSSMELVVGDADAEDNDLLLFQGSGNNGVLLQWYAYPLLLMADQYADPSSGNQLQIDIQDTSRILMTDTDGNTVALLMSDLQAAFTGSGTVEMMIRELDWCDTDGNTKILVLCSAPYVGS